jgi:hypothetical protein
MSGLVSGGVIDDLNVAIIVANLAHTSITLFMGFLINTCPR